MFQSSRRDAPASVTFESSLLSEGRAEHVLPPRVEYPCAVADASDGRTLVNVEVLNPTITTLCEPLEPGTRRGENRSYPVICAAKWGPKELEVMRSWRSTEARKIGRYGDVLGSTVRPFRWMPASNVGDGSERHRGVLWSESYGALVLEPLCLPDSFAHGWNEESCIVGCEQDPSLGLEYPLIWRGNLVRELPYRPQRMALPEGFECGAAYAINDSRIAVGSAFNLTHDRASHRVPIAWVNDSVFQLPTVSGKGDAISVVSSNVALGISGGMLVLWDLRPTREVGEPGPVRCIQLDSFGPQSSNRRGTYSAWIVERKGVLGVITPTSISFVPAHEPDALANAPVYPLKGSFENGAREVLGVTSDLRLITVARSEAGADWALFPIPFRSHR